MWEFSIAKAAVKCSSPDIWHVVTTTSTRSRRKTLAKQNFWMKMRFKVHFWDLLWTMLNAANKPGRRWRFYACSKMMERICRCHPFLGQAIVLRRHGKSGVEIWEDGRKEDNLGMWTMMWNIDDMKRQQEASGAVRLRSMTHQQMSSGFEKSYFGRYSFLWR